MTCTRPLHALRSADADRFGGKSASLGELLAAGIPVPGGFAVAAEAFTTFAVETGLHDHAARLLDGVDLHDTAAVHRAADAIARDVRRSPMPAAVRDEIAARYASLRGAGGDGDAPVAVRSSAIGEDSDEATFAGQQETYLWVRGGDAVCGAVRDCWASLFSAPAITYRARMGDPAATPAMGVTVQEMVDAEVSGVLFTCNPVSGDPSVIAVNASWGLGLAVVGGEVTPDDFLVSKVTGEVLRSAVADKHVEHVADPGGAGTVEREVDPQRRAAACLSDERLAELAALAKRIQRHFGAHQDVEWAFSRDGRLLVLQSRPVTAVATPAAGSTQPASALSMVMSTFGAGSARR